MKYIIYILIGITFASCLKEKKPGNSDSRSERASLASEVAIPENKTSGNSTNCVIEDEQEKSKVQLIIKSAKIAVRTEDNSKAAIILKHLWLKFDVMVQNQKQETDNYTKTGTYTLRVESTKFDELSDSIKQLGVECTQDESVSEDVTSEYIDLGIRLKTKRASYEQYLGLIRQAKSVDEVLKIQESARILLEEIESMEGRIKFLSNGAQYSTISLTVFENIKYVSKADGFWYKVKGQFNKGFEMLEELLLFGITIWPLLLLILSIALLRKRIKRFWTWKWEPKIS